ncbi:RNA binding protein, heterogenous nuclear RNP-K like protein [Dispira simplex]|nr:RNA binding protein, heterogenous nuclear RNP-K like protein [Dispira simplex]
MASSQPKTFSPTIRSRKAKATAVSLEDNPTFATQKTLRSKLTALAQDGSSDATGSNRTRPTNDERDGPPTTETYPSSVLSGEGSSIAHTTTITHSTTTGMTKASMVTTRDVPPVSYLTEPTPAPHDTSYHSGGGSRLNSTAGSRAFLFDQGHPLRAMGQSTTDSTSFRELSTEPRSSEDSQHTTDAGLNGSAGPPLGLGNSSLNSVYHSPLAPVAKDLPCDHASKASGTGPRDSALSQSNREAISRLGRLNLDSNELLGRDPLSNPPATASLFSRMNRRERASLTEESQSESFVMPPSAPPYTLNHPSLNYSYGNQPLKSTGLFDKFERMPEYQETRGTEGSTSLLFNTSTFPSESLLASTDPHGDRHSQGMGSFGMNPLTLRRVSKGEGSINPNAAFTSGEHNGHQMGRLASDNVDSSGSSFGLLTENVRKLSMSHDHLSVSDTSIGSGDRAINPTYDTMTTRRHQAREASVRGMAPAVGRSQDELVSGDPHLRIETHLVLRALVTSKEAGVIIGKNGSNVARLRHLYGVKAGVSKAVSSVPDRILTVSGPYDQVAQAYAFLAQNLLENPITASTAITGVTHGNGGRYTPISGLPPNMMPPSGNAQAHLTTVRILISHNLMGTVIGRQGLKIKHIQEVSGARMDAQKEMLPQSTERVVEIQGTVNAIRIALEEVGMCLIEDTERGMGSVLYNPATRVPSISSNCNPYINQVRVPANMLSTGPSTDGSMGSVPSYAEGQNLRSPLSLGPAANATEEGKTNGMSMSSAGISNRGDSKHASSTSLSQLGGNRGDSGLTVGSHLPSDATLDTNRSNVRRPSNHTEGSSGGPGDGWHGSATAYGGQYQPTAGGAHHSLMHSRGASLSQADSMPMYTSESSSQPPYMHHMMPHHPPAPGFSGQMDATTNGGHPHAPHLPSLGSYQQHPLAPPYSSPSGPMVGGATMTNPMYHPPPHSFQGPPPPHPNGPLPHHPPFPPNMTPHPPPPTGIQRYGSYPMPPTAGPMYGSYGMVHHPHHHPYIPPPLGAITGPSENTPGYHPPPPPNNSVSYVGSSSSGAEQAHAIVAEPTATSNP